MIETLENTPKRYFKPHTSKIEQLQTECIVCQKISKYICPKCHEHYCSLECYKTHSNTCTEQFYQENCEAYLKGKKMP